MDINALNKIKTHYNFNPSNILDIGANDGYFANLCRTIWPTSNLTLVEANPFWSDTLKEKNYKHIITLLGNEKKQSVDFYVNKKDKGSTGCSMYKEISSFFDENNCETISLQMNRLDDITNETFDFIKMDTQGSELDIIKGGLDTIKKCKYLLIEVSLIPLNENGPLKEDIVRFLSRNDIKPVDVLYDHIIDGELTQQDVLFVNE